MNIFLSTSTTSTNIFYFGMWGILNFYTMYKKIKIQFADSKEYADWLLPLVVRSNPIRVNPLQGKDFVISHGNESQLLPRRTSAILREHKVFFHRIWKILFPVDTLVHPFLALVCYQIPSVKCWKILRHAKFCRIIIAEIKSRGLSLQNRNAIYKNNFKIQWFLKNPLGVQ